MLKNIGVKIQIKFKVIKKCRSKLRCPESLSEVSTYTKLRNISDVKM
jgi:hypothetical protein